VSGLSVALAGRVGQFALDMAFVAPVGVTALVGPSGSGKTSVLRAIAGLQRLGGTVELDGEIWQDDRHFVAPHHRRIGFVFQGANLLPHLSVADNLAYARRRSPAPAELGPIVEATGVAPLLLRRPDSLSGGEAQRAALTRALAGNPRLLLMDEPLSALDAEARGALLDWLGAFLPTLGLPVLLVSHYPAEVARLATHQIRLRDGRVER
jgi:molybdate transport system ATP-binding protein